MAHLKRLIAPRSWSIPKRIGKWVVKPSPGPHATEGGIPLTVVLRDMLKYVDTARESRHVITTGNVLVNGRIQRDTKFPIGLMDIIEFPNSKEAFRAMINNKGKIMLEPIDKPTYRLCRIENKTMLKGGKTQLNLWGGVNVITDDTGYKVGDVVKLGLADSKIQGKLELKKGTKALIIGGANVGKTATVKSIEKDVQPRQITLDYKEGNKEIKTLASKVYLIE